MNMPGLYFWGFSFLGVYCFYMKHISNNFTIIPEKLSDDIDSLDVSNCHKSKIVHFVKILMDKSWQSSGTLTSEVEIPVKYFRKVFGSKYLEWLKPIVAKNIIFINHSYSNINNNIYSKSYTLNAIYFSFQPIMLPLFEIPCKTVGYKQVYKNCDDEFFSIKNLTNEDFKLLKIDYEGLLKIMQNEIEKLNISEFKTNEDISKTEFNVIIKESDRQRTYWLQKDRALEIAFKDRKSLIEDSGKYYLMDEYEFILMKRQAIYMSYKDCIQKMHKGWFFSKRNETNRRLDTNFTNMANILTKRICQDNNLVQFDLANSQFAILSDIFSKDTFTPDFEIFKRESYNGTLYEYIQQNLNVDSRSKAKLMVFQLLFSKETNSDPKKDEIRKLFPSVVDKIDEFKIKNGYKNFSISLQKRESEIFIDGLWKKLKLLGYFCITKHDCIIVRREDKETIKNIISEFFTEINFHGKIVED